MSRRRLGRDSAGKTSRCRQAACLLSVKFRLNCGHFLDTGNVARVARKNDTLLKCSEETAMGILLWMVFGLVAGVVAKWIMPGRDPGGIMVTILLGIGGAMVGGMIGTAFGIGGMSGFDICSLMIAIGGALILLIGYRFVATRMTA